MARSSHISGERSHGVGHEGPHHHAEAEGAVGEEVGEVAGILDHGEDFGFCCE